MKERRTDQYDTDSGPVVLNWHEGMSNDELTEVIEWLGLMQRKLKRLIKLECDGKAVEMIVKGGGLEPKVSVRGSWGSDGMEFTQYPVSFDPAQPNILDKEELNE